MTEVGKVFESLSDAFAAQDQIRDRIRAKRDEANMVIQVAVRCVQTLFKSADLTDGIETAKTALLKTGPAIKAIEDVLPPQPGCIYRYVDFWHHQLQSISMVCAVIDAISGSTLTRLDEMSSRIGASIHIPLEHYLGGICQSLSELTRLSRNRVIRQDYETPIACFRFASYIFDGLKQLNLKNDFLRKKYDGVKYDVNHLENIMYDLTIRGLTTNNNKKRPAESDIAPPSRKANNKDQMVLSPSNEEKETPIASEMTDDDPGSKSGKR